MDLSFKNNKTKEKIDNKSNEKDDIKNLNNNLLILIEIVKKINLHLSHIDYDIKKIKESVGIKNEKDN